LPKFGGSDRDDFCKWLQDGEEAFDRAQIQLSNRFMAIQFDDLCDIFKMIFVGANPPKRIHLRKVLTVRMRKVAEAL
jgi:hypothetical protein